jgi:nucleotide-binding universal stress UspA family protein
VSRLVVGYDRTEASRRAVEWAASRVGPEGRLVLVHADRPLHAPPDPLATNEERRRFGRAIVDELLLEGEDELRDLDLRVEISDRDPVRALLAAAEAHEADGIVIGSRRHSALRRALGTVTTELIVRSPVPVTAVPSEAAAASS